MIIKEFRVPLPFTLEEYRIAQLFTAAQTSLEQTGGGEGVEILANEPFENVPLLGGRFTAGQFTHKVYHCKSKVPKTVAAIAPEGSLILHEKSWNSYPYCKTVVTNPIYMKEDFILSIETMHCNDGGLKSNVHELSPAELEAREVVLIDIASPQTTDPGNADEDPAEFRSTKTGRGPLEPGEWMHEMEPLMTAYKLVRCEFKWWGLQTIIERKIMNFEQRIIFVFHRKLFCWMDRWHGMTMADIRRFEAQVAVQLEEKREGSPLKDGAIDVS